MIHVTVYKDEADHYKGFRCDGHAAYADEGEDIVCSAVSVLVINTCNAIEQLTADAYSMGSDAESGLIDVDFSEIPGHDTTLLMDTMVMGLRSIEEQYSEFIHLEVKEV